MNSTAGRQRAATFHYRGLNVGDSQLRARYESDGVAFEELVTFEELASLRSDGVRAVAELWYLVAGLSYYKTGAAHHIDLGVTPVGPAGREWFEAALRDGLGEFAFRNELDLSDVTITGGVAPPYDAVSLDATRVLTPFGGGIDSVVTTTSLAPHVDQSLFVVSPASGRFAPLEATAAITGLPVARATRTLDPALSAPPSTFFHGHVPVTAMVALLAAVAAVADGRGGVALSNEHSASVPNTRHGDRDVNHQWSKSWRAEQLLSAALAERVGNELVVTSFLRDRSELWVAQQFSQHRDYLATFRSCNRAFSQQASQRAAQWCGECDKCLFINLVLAPFVPRRELKAAMGVEPLADPARREQLKTLVGLGLERKPFECVGDPTECGVALQELQRHPEWRDETNVTEVAPYVDPGASLDELLQPQGESRVPADWLR